VFELCDAAFVQQSIDRMDAVGGVFRYGVFEKVTELSIALLAGSELGGVGHADVNREVDIAGVIEVGRRGEQSVCVPTEVAPAVGIVVIEGAQLCEESPTDRAVTFT